MFYSLIKHSAYDNDSNMDNLVNLFNGLTIGEEPKTVIYARMSSDAQASIPDQVEACEAYARQNNLPVDVYVFTDIGSGMNVSKLANHTAMLNKLIENVRSHIVVNDMSRLGRCVEVFNIMNTLVSAGIKIHSVEDNLIVDKDSPFSVVRACSLIGAAIEFSRNLSTKIKKSLAMKKKRGVFTGRKAPYGFKIVVVETMGVAEKFLVKDPATFVMAKRLARYVSTRVKRPLGMTSVALSRHRRMFQEYVAMSKKTPQQ